MFSLSDQNMLKILWIQNQANNRRINGNDTLQEIIVEVIVGIFFGSVSSTMTIE